MSFCLNGNPRARLIAGGIFLATPSAESHNDVGDEG